MSACGSSALSPALSGSGGTRSAPDSGAGGTGGTTSTSLVRTDSAIAADIPAEAPGAGGRAGAANDGGDKDTPATVDVATGGTVGTGGTSATGGATGSGGSVVGTGGAKLDASIGPDGTVADGGLIGLDSAGAPEVAAARDTSAEVDGGAARPSCTLASNNVCFSNGHAQGLMSGWGWVALGELDTITDPTCETNETYPASAPPCIAGVQWSSPDALCVSGTIPAITSTEYDRNWGIQLGLNAHEPPEVPFGEAYASVTFKLTGLPSTGLRAVVHRKGDSSSILYCAPLSPGVPIPFTAFNTSCWGGSSSFKVADVSAIDKFAILVPSTDRAITVANLCLTEISLQ